MSSNRSTKSGLILRIYWNRPASKDISFDFNIHQFHHAIRCTWFFVYDFCWKCCSHSWSYKLTLSHPPRSSKPYERLSEDVKICSGLAQLELNERPRIKSIFLANGTEQSTTNRFLPLGTWAVLCESYEPFIFFFEISIVTNNSRVFFLTDL